MRSRHQGIMLNNIIVILVLAPILCFGQDIVKLKGRVMDQTSRQPLALATIGIRNYSIGTMANETGEFEFHIPTDLKNDTLLISFIGYKTFKERVSDFTEGSVIYLDQTPIQLKDVTVTSDGARKLVEQALKAIPSVYSNQPYLMEGFHRSWEKMEIADSGSFPGTLIEAAVTIYDPGYVPRKNGKNAREEIYINEIRRGSLMKGWDYHGNILGDMLNKNLVRQNRVSPFIFLKSFLDFPNHLNYEWDGTTQMDGEELAIIKIDIPNARKFPAGYRVYISETDYAILRFDVYGSKAEIDYSLGPWHTENLFETYIFKRYLQKPYLNYCKIQYTIKKLDLKQKKVLRVEDYHREFQVNNIVTTAVEEKRKSLSAQKAKGVSLAVQSKVYNKAFWENYNMILENPMDKEIVEYFEQGHSNDDSLKAGKVRKK